LATSNVYITIIDPQWRWMLSGTEWDALNTLLAIHAHPVGALMLLNNVDLDQRQGLAWAEGVLNLTAVVHNDRKNPQRAHERQLWRYYHVDRWAPIAQRICRLRPAKINIVIH